MAKTPLLVSHDGSVDEFAAIALLCGPDFLAHYDIVGVVVINGDTLGVPAYWCTKRILNMCGQSHVPVGLSKTRAVNGFPWAYRQFPLILNTLPALPEMPGLDDVSAIPDGDILLENIIRNAADGELAVLSLGGMTPLADSLSASGQWSKIKSIYWMGGTLDTLAGGKVVAESVGNIDPGIVPNAPMHSEWNVYYDPMAVQTMYRNALPSPIYQFPLNVTNAYPNSADWIRSELNPVANKGHQVVDFLANAYAAVVPQGGASLWDVVTTIGLMNENNAAGKTFYTFETREVWVETQYGPNEGRIMEATTGSGRVIQVAQQHASVDEVRGYALDQWASIPDYGRC